MWRLLSPWLLVNVMTCIYHVQNFSIYRPMLRERFALIQFLFAPWMFVLFLSATQHTKQLVFSQHHACCDSAWHIYTGRPVSRVCMLTTWSELRGAEWVAGIIACGFCLGGVQLAKAANINLLRMFAPCQPRRAERIAHEHRIIHRVPLCISRGNLICLKTALVLALYWINITGCVSAVCSFPCHVFFVWQRNRPFDILGWTLR